jgi:hypothetical protein
MLSQPWLVLINRLPLQPHPLLPLHIVLDLIEIFGACTGTCGARDVPAGMMCS